LACETTQVELLPRCRLASNATFVLGSGGLIWGLVEFRRRAGAEADQHS
jgi:hypothetical protein